MSETIAAIAIGRNEGARLVKCLAALVRLKVSPVIYVDSGSTDDSVEEAQKIGAVVVALDMSVPLSVDGGASDFQRPRVGTE